MGEPLKLEGGEGFLMAKSASQMKRGPSRQQEKYEQRHRYSERMQET